MTYNPKSDFGKGFAAGMDFALALDTYRNGTFRRSAKQGDVCRTDKATAAIAEAEALFARLIEAERDAR